jgi:hypothetical protein
MIEKPTVFVLGAGAHVSYGFPSGPGLKKQIVKTIAEACGTPDIKRYGELLPNSSMLQGDLNELQRILLGFANALRMSAQTSIDAFMQANEHQPE